MSGYDFAFTAIDGERRCRWRSIAAGRCSWSNTVRIRGFTPQYADLEAVWQRYRGRGLVVIGVPSNDFGEQEPGTTQEIKTFCESRYAVDFPLTQKQDVVGPTAHPFFRWIAAERRGGRAALELPQIPV